MKIFPPSLQSEGRSFVACVAVVLLTCANAEFDASLNLYRIPLTRHSVPVTRKGKVVSHKRMYSGSVHLGLPSQPFRVVFDTGSGHVVVPSVECQTKQCVIHKRYDYSLSSTAVAINIDKRVVASGHATDEVTVMYGTGTIVGEFVKERVCLGSFEFARANADCVQMGFIQATQLSYNPFFVIPVDGIFGLGLSNLALDPEFSFFEMLVRSGRIDVPQFSMFIGEGDEDSELAIGGHNPAHLASPLNWTPVAMVEKGFWQIKVLAVHVGKRTLDICKDGSCRAIIDTGTSHIGVPADSRQNIDSLLTISAGHLEDCQLADAPSISIEVAGFNLTMGPNNYMRRLPLPVRQPRAGPNGEGDVQPIVHNASTFCKPLLMPVSVPAPMGPNLFIIGEPLLRRYYTVFDWAERAIGFGLAANKQTVHADDTLIFMQQSLDKREDGFSFIQIVVATKNKIRGC